VDTWKNFLNCFSPVGIDADDSTICSSLLAVQSTKDGSSLSIVLNKFFMATIGLNLAGAAGVGKIARKAKSYSRVTKFFVADDAGALEEALHTCCWAQERSAAAWGAMVERGDRTSIHVGFM